MRLQSVASNAGNMVQSWNMKGSFSVSNADLGKGSEDDKVQYGKISIVLSEKKCKEQILYN